DDGMGRFVKGIILMSKGDDVKIQIITVASDLITIYRLTGHSGLLLIRWVPEVTGFLMASSPFPGVLRVSWELVPEAPPSGPGPWTGVACWPCPNEDAYENLTSQLRNLKMEPGGGHDHDGFSEIGSKDIDDLNKYLKESVEKETSSEDHQVGAIMVTGGDLVQLRPMNMCQGWLASRQELVIRIGGSMTQTPRSTSTFVSLGGRNGPEEDNT
ncbi:hypothetical protein FOZ62_010372, partial [Perkinsus olseni]